MKYRNVFRSNSGDIFIGAHIKATVFRDVFIHIIVYSYSPQLSPQRYIREIGFLCYIKRLNQEKRTHPYSWPWFLVLKIWLQTLAKMQYSELGH